MRIRILSLLLASSLGCQVAPRSALIISVAGRRLALSAAEWQPMKNEAEYAKNFEARLNRSPRQYQILTVFLNQMSEDRKAGREIASGEHLEIFISNPNEVTVLLRRDYGVYWLLSREMFRGISVRGVDLSTFRPLSQLEENAVIAALSNEIDGTRHLLAETVAR